MSEMFEKIRLAERAVEDYAGISFVRRPLLRVENLPEQVERCGMCGYPLDDKGCVNLHCRNELLKASLQGPMIDGLFMEFGVYQGDTITQISLIRKDKTIYGFDCFEGLPEAWEGRFVKGSLKCQIPQVPENVELVIGLFQDTLEPFLGKHKETVSFLHMDADLYSSTRYVLGTLAKNHRIINGTVIQFDEYKPYKKQESDEEKAFTEILKEFDYGCFPIGECPDPHLQKSFVMVVD